MRYTIFDCQRHISGFVLGFAVITFNNYNLVFLVNLHSEAYLKHSWQKSFHVYNCVKSIHGTHLFPIDFRNTGERFWEYDRRELLRIRPVKRSGLMLLWQCQIFTEFNIKINGFKEIIKVFHWRFNMLNIFLWWISFTKMFSKKST